MEDNRNYKYRVLPISNASWDCFVKLNQPQLNMLIMESINKNNWLFDMYTLEDKIHVCCVLGIMVLVNIMLTSSAYMYQGNIMMACWYFLSLLNYLERMHNLIMPETYARLNSWLGFQWSKIWLDVNCPNLLLSCIHHQLLISVLDIYHQASLTGLTSSWVNWTAFVFT